ncbi:NAD(P)H-dependent oxidoreductase [Luteimonas deserti]|uniref:NAD(P)H-dependent oxidoreductase n=1 Tax=Luteimonas deserti TaxID=2752306 RepID=A0A7Z0TZ50_9GAMM|nr:NAD(P)H-dependent oxidoreductase [Luteimonas deserti]NYZ61868.1 NAD(P)H-dependent oxidoreductase [Luteimonas deserti]
MSKQILIVQGHPASDSLCEALASAYAQGARESGHSVVTLRLREMRFDPVLHAGYAALQPLEPDLVAAQAAIVGADHIVLVYPTWWGGTPALLKGFLDRTLLPGFAFKYRAGSPWWDRLLTGRSAHVITTMDTPPWYYRLRYGDAGIRQLRHAVLEYCGVRPVRVTRVGRVKEASARRIERWLGAARRAGAEA